MSEKKLTLRETIIPKSDQLNYDDFIAGPITAKVKTLKLGSVEQPVIIVLERDGLEIDRPWKPCKTMRRVLIAVWGDGGKAWIGQSLTLFGDATVKWAGQAIGGIRVSHMSGIAEARTFKLSVSKGKRAEYTIQPLDARPPESADTVPDDISELM